MTKRRASTTIRTGRWRLLIAAGAVAAGLGIAGLAYAAEDGTAVIGQLKAPDAVAKAITSLSGAVSNGGDFSKEPNANAVPFLGGTPGSHVSDLFAGLGNFPGIANINAGADDVVQALDDDVSAAFGSAAPTREYICDTVPCVLSTNLVKEVTELRIHLKIEGEEQSALIPFASLGLPSMGFLPVDEKLLATLDWTVNTTLVATRGDLHLAPAASGPALDLKATIQAPTGNYLVNLGALKVRVTTLEQPQFKGHLLVDIADDGSFDFSFGPATGFHALWSLKTEASPLMGLSGNLDIDWALTGAGVNPGELTIKLDKVVMNASEFVGQGMQEAASSLRDITRPLRTATSPLMEPIPGMSDFSTVLGGQEVTMLRLMELAKTVSGEDKTKFREALERLFMLDDVVAALEGGGTDIPLGSFTLAGDKALKPVAIPLKPEEIQGALDRVLDKCDACKDSVNALLEAVNGEETPGESGFQFDLPVLTQPESLAGLLLGRDVDLITFDTGKLGYDDHLNIPLARFFLFSVELDGDIDASVHLRGGVDTRGIVDAVQSGKTGRIANGVYLTDPGSDAVVRLFSNTGIRFAFGISVVEVSIEGGPKLDVALEVPTSAPANKLRPAILEDGIGCALVEDPGNAEFSVFITATFDYWIDEEVETLAQHTFLTEQDLCEPQANDKPVAENDNGVLRILTAKERGVPAGEPDTINVFMRDEPSPSDPKIKIPKIVVTTNGNKYGSFTAADYSAVRYVGDEADREVIFRVVANDGVPFDKRVEVDTNDGPDDVFIDSKAFGEIAVNGGNDRVFVTAGSTISGGDGDDTITGSEFADFLGGGNDNDTINGGGGFDVVDGGRGNDRLMDSSPEGNCITGGEGNDLLVGGPSGDFLSGDEGFCGDSAVANLTGEETGASGGGNDDIVTGGGTDFVVAGDGDDDVRIHPTFDNRIIALPGDDLWAAGITVHGNGGKDAIQSGKGRDTIHGGPGDDTIEADGGPKDPFALRNGDVDTIKGGFGADTIWAEEASDVVFGDNGKDACPTPFTGQPAEADADGGNDTVHGGPGADRIALEAGDDTAYGDDSGDAICGHAGNDTVYGGAGTDTVFGGTGGDSIDGEGNEDELYGNAGGDTIKGGTASDRIVGGSNKAALADAGDTIDGGDEPDVIIGDNGQIVVGPAVGPSVFDLFSSDPSLGGSDTINGGAGEDRIFGGLSGDTIHGDGEDDHLEGNTGDDAVYGDAGEDDIIGGTSPEALPGATAGQTAADAPDVGETILSGGAGRDVIIGDNGIITRPGGTDPIIGGVARAVTLLDRERTGAALAAVSGGDYVEGNQDSDRIYGQGGADYLKGSEHDDFVEGNQDGDRLEGNDGEDDLIGGSSFTSAPGVGDPDGADRIAGGAGADVLLGDNAAISRATTGAGGGFDWDSVANNWLGQTARRSITLLDKATFRTANFGADVLSGGAGVDVAFGQDGDDALFGGSDDDYQEGNGGADVLYGDQVAPATGDPRESAQPQLDGAPGPDGQDDQIGGSSWIKSSPGGDITGQRDGNDELHGDGNADVQLGDNGRILRVIVNGQYQTWLPTTGKPTVVRQAASSGNPPTQLPARFDVGAAPSAGVWGNDVLFGDGGDDLQLGQDGDDTLYGGDADDDMYGELGADRMFGEGGEDAMVGDRGVIANSLVTTPGATFSVTAPPRVSFTPYAAHPLDRRVNLNVDGDGNPLQAPGMTTGGNDFMRGGPDHDSMHGAAGNDLMNGDGGGDYLFGADGADVMWGGKGRDCADPADLECLHDRGVDDAFVDYLFGGRGLKTDPVTGGADILDFRPRPGIDPAAWFEITSTRSTDALADHQHHQGIDWIYGGWDRDVMEADVADNGPNEGDRLIDWTGAYNLYNHCPAAYGGYNDIRQFSPSMQSFLEQLAFALGAGQSLADLRTKGTSGYNELALVYNADVKSNSGSAYPTTPGHFEQFSCEP